jgi:endonuclease-3
MKKQTLDIDRFMKILSDQYRTWNAPVITLIANRGASPFEILISTLLSLRTKDAVTGEASNARRPTAFLPWHPLPRRCSPLTKRSCGN